MMVRVMMVMVMVMAMAMIMMMVMTIGSNQGHGHDDGEGDGYDDPSQNQAVGIWMSPFKEPPSHFPAFRSHSAFAAFPQYMRPLRLTIGTTSQVLTSSDFEKIFYKVEEIHGIHTKFYNDLEQRVSNWSVRQIIGDLFMALVSE